MKTTNEAVETAQRFNRLYVQVIREQRKRNPDHQRIDQLKRTAAKTSARLRRLMGW